MSSRPSSGSGRSSSVRRSGSSSGDKKVLRKVPSDKSLRNECPICHNKFGDAVFESHVDLCLKQSFVKEAARGKKIGPKTLAKNLQALEKSMFDFLDMVEAAAPTARTDEAVVAHQKRLSRSIDNFQARLTKIYEKLNVDISSSAPREAVAAAALPSPAKKKSSGARRVGSKGDAPPAAPVEQLDEGPNSTTMTMSKNDFMLFEEFLKKEGTCNVCKELKGPEHVLLNDACGHRVCPDCLRQFLRRLLRSKGDNIKPADMHCIASTTCQERIPDWMSKVVLSKEKYDMLVNASFKGYMAGNADSYVSCPNEKCGLVFEAVSGNIDDIKGEKRGPDGKMLSEEAKLHRAKCRFRCPKCTIVFCSECNADPYHDGFTCEQFVEYKEAKHCRFCETQLTKDNTAKPPVVGGGPGIENVCTSDECLEKRKGSCTILHECGHPCLGVKNEKTHLPCLQSDCPSCPAEEKVNADDFCNICWIESIGSAPSVKLDCGHTFHMQCVRDRISKRWSGARITFNFLNCPLCKVPISHELLAKELRPYHRLLDIVEAKALKRLKHEGLEECDDVLDAGSKYYQQPSKYALDIFAYYPCYKCRVPYFGGRRACEEAADDSDDKYNPKDLICPPCQSGNDLYKCKIHGRDFIEFKCKWCCSVASFFCWGTTHFCQSCHKKQEVGEYLTKKKRSELPVCPGPKKCPLGIKHPPNGEEFPLGCAICRRRENF